MWSWVSIVRQDLYQTRQQYSATDQHRDKAADVRRVFRITAIENALLRECCCVHVQLSMERRTIVLRRSSAAFQTRDASACYTTWWRQHRRWLPRRSNLGSSRAHHDCDVTVTSSRRDVIAGDIPVKAHALSHSVSAKRPRQHQSTYVSEHAKPRRSNGNVLQLLLLTCNN